MQTAPQTEKKRAPLPLLAALLPAVAVAVLVWQLRYDPADPFASALQGIVLGSLILVLNSPVFALMPPLLVEFTNSAYVLPEGASLRLLVTGLGLLFGVGAVLRLCTSMDSRAMRVVGPAVALIVLATALNGVYTDLDYTVKYLRYQMVQLVVLLLAAAVVRDRRDLKIVALVVLGVGVASAAVAIWQHYDRAGALYIGVPPEKYMAGQRRAYGLMMNYVHTANGLLWPLAALVGVLLATTTRRLLPRLALVASVVVLAVGLYFTYTRSALLALGPALLTMSLFLSAGRRMFTYFLLALAVFAYLTLQGTGLIGVRYYQGAEENKSAADHLALLEVGILIAVDNPILGIGHQAFEELAADYAVELSESPTEEGPSGATALGSARPHNDFLLVWMSWGIFALAAYCAIFLGALLNFAQAARSSDPLMRGLAVGGIGALGAYAANSFFHNYLDSSTLLWVFAGLSVAMVRLPMGAGLAHRTERVLRSRRLARLARRREVAA